MRDSLALSLAHLEDQVSEMEERLHPNHYLMLLGKRHLVGSYGIDLDIKSTEILEKRASLCEEVNRNPTPTFVHYKAPK